MPDLPPINQDIPIMTINVDFQEHNWVQKGDYLHCEGGCTVISNSNASRHGTRLPTGVMLVGSPGNWGLEMERGNVRNHENYAKARIASVKASS